MCFFKKLFGCKCQKDCKCAPGEKCNCEEKKSCCGKEEKPVSMPIESAPVQEGNPQM